jgi:L-ascorbate metabolism protein UlaG (beta-lactamase superfamily)
MDNILRQWNVKNELQTAGWYQKYNTTHTQVEVFFLPARHWSRRGLTDTNKRLWGSFLLQTNDTKIYFSGDTGYGSHLKEVKDLFGDIDYFICGIGAYKPEWFMHPNHISPKDALKAANEMQAKYFVPMHYGTFDLSDEPISEPIKELKIHGQNLQTNVLMPHLAQAIYF